MKRTKLVVGLVVVALLLMAAAPLAQITRFRDLLVTNDITIGDDLTVGDSATVTTDLTVGNDLTVTGDLATSGGFTPGSTFDAGSNVISQTINTENIGLPTILTVPFTYTAAAGGTGTVATIADGEIWLVHSVFISVTTNFDATGDDVTLVIGDGGDPDGFIVAADANLQTTFTEATGFAAGWYGIENGSAGAYTTDEGGPFVYAPVGAAETIDYLIDETSGETITAGAATVYVVYTRIQ
jgi:hypothetical protein